MFILRRIEESLIQITDLSIILFYNQLNIWNYLFNDDIYILSHDLLISCCGRSFIPHSCIYLYLFLLFLSSLHRYNNSIPCPVCFFSSSSLQTTMLIKSLLINLILLLLFIIHVITSIGKFEYFILNKHKIKSVLIIEQCNSKETCSSCLSLSNQCAWCTQVKWINLKIN